MTPARPSIDVLGDLKRTLDNIELSRADTPKAIVRDSMVPVDKAFALRTSKGIFLLVHPDALATVRHGDALTALWGIRVLNRLPSDAEPFGEEIAWESIAAPPR